MIVNLVNKEIVDNYGEELLKERGVTDVKYFLNPDSSALQSWRGLDNILAAANLVEQWGKAGGSFAIIVDPDVDGFCANAIFYNYMKRAFPRIKIDWYLHSGKQHGLEDTWELINEKHYDILVVMDAGSNDGKYIQELNIPTVVIDHHELEEIAFFPENMILVNNQTSNNYKNKDLSGGGLVYQFCRAMDELYGFKYADDYIDLAALAVCGDMMSGLEIENQYLWKKGFSNIKNSFFKTLVEKQDFSMGGKVNPITVAFYIVPLINAMVRSGTQEEKERMFLAFIDGEQMVPCNKRGCKGTMERVDIESARECTNARSRQNKKLEEAEQMVEVKIAKHDLLSNKVLFIRLEEEDDFPPEINGLLAMKLSAKYKRPTIVARMNDYGEDKGSIRGVNNSPIRSFKDFLIDSGYFMYVQGC